jgi:hypothetical protein
MIRRAIRKIGTTLSLWRKLQEWQTACADRRHWDERIKNVLACPDNVRLPRVRDAGKIVNHYQIMHNGLKVTVGGYYGDGITRMLEANRGCHEPQEEVLFNAVLSRMEPAAVMVECGAYWGFYSMWLRNAVPNAKVFLVEPDAKNLLVGQMNFSLNGLSGEFIQAYVGDVSSMYNDGTPIICMDQFAVSRKLARIDILHADIQGAEVQMLHGAAKLLRERKIRFLFISTHRPDLHEECAQFVVTQKYRILASVTLDESYSLDGFLVAAHPAENITDLPQPSKKPIDRTL